MSKEELIIGILWAALVTLAMLYQRAISPHRSKRDDEHIPRLW